MNSSAPIKSPCILVCAIEPESGHCYGCGRNRDEIAGWMNFSAEFRDQIMEELPARVSKLERRPRRVTRRARLRGDTKRRDVLDISS
ncbi:MAG: DUF1289 domain-containing protein [Rhizobiaceae bacterium]|nr:DUF1289 domain-containing protein [Rhizobiaceae bacterium]